MPDSAAIRNTLASQRALQTRRDEDQRRRVLRAALITAALQATIGTGGIFLILGQSVQEWGSLPSSAGQGGLLYFGVGIALFLLWLLVAHAWYLWRQPS